MDRFWAKVRKTKTCWIWTGATTRDGYGSYLLYPSRKVVNTHRYIFEKTNNIQLQSNQLVCHSCDTPNCVNPAHLWLGDSTANTADMVSKKRQAHKLTEKQVKEIRDSNLSSYKLADIYGCSKTNINNIKNKIVWKWL